MKLEQSQQRIVEACVHAIHGPNIPGIRYLLNLGLDGTAEELAKLEGAIHSAVVSELEAFTKAHRK